MEEAVTCVLLVRSRQERCVRVLINLIPKHVKLAEMEAILSSVLLVATKQELLALVAELAIPKLALFVEMDLSMLVL